jgi:glucokinase
MTNPVNLDRQPRPDSRPLAVGVDIGGTKTELAVVDGDGTVLSSYRVPTAPERGAAALIADIIAGARASFEAHLAAACAIGVSVAGQVSASGVVVGAPNLGWAGVPLGAELSRELGLPTVVVNDVRAAAWAEWRFGAGRGCDDVVVLFLGTGIGGSAISGGRMIEGSDNVAGEFGHVTLVANGRPCHCRNHGCLEAYAGGWAIAERAQEAARVDAAGASTMIELAGRAADITPEIVAAAAQRGDRVAASVVHDTGSYVGAALVGLVNAFNPRRVILGGGIIDGFPEIIPAAARIVRERSLPAAATNVELIAATLGNQAPVVGAASLAGCALDRTPVTP